MRSGARELAWCVLGLWSVGLTAGCTVGVEVIPRVDAAVGVDAAASDAGGGTDAARPDAGRPSGCVARAEAIYLVSYTQELLRYEPANAHAVTDLGRIDCPLTPSREPFDNAHMMTVDRTGRAWVFDQGGALYHVDTTDASCTGTPFEMGQEEFEFLGATFRYDPSATPTATPGEVLFVSGGPASGGDTDPSAVGWRDQIAILDTDTFELRAFDRLERDVAAVVASNGDGELFAALGSGDSSQLHRVNAADGTVSSPSGTIPAGVGYQASYVFWGGRFYFFLPLTGENGSAVYTYTEADGSWELVHTIPTYRIVGSGVSTCAPVELI